MAGDCADWLELSALVADDGNASAADLEKLMRQGSTFEGSATDGGAIDRHVLDVFGILSQRVNLAEDAYPFVINGLKVEKRTDSKKFLPYLFCLCLSYFKDEHPATPDIKPRLLFEQISAVALAGYLGTDEALVFGTGRLNTFSKPGFKAAIDELVTLIGEGGSFKNQPTLSKKDDHVDVVAVKHFQDRLQSKLIIFGQCATGNNWQTKLSELDPDAFCRNWLTDSLASTPSLTKSFFIPFTVAPGIWSYCCNYAGILFERLRLAHFATTRSIHALTTEDEMSRWVDACTGLRRSAAKRNPKEIAKRLRKKKKQDSQSSRPRNTSASPRRRKVKARRPIQVRALALR